MFNFGIKTKLINYLNATWLFFLLALLFWLQNQTFISWLKISDNSFFLRRSLVAFALGLILYCPYIFVNKKIVKNIYLLIISLAISLIFISQFLYYSYSGGFLQFSALKYASEAKDIAGTIKNLLTPKLLLFATNFLIVLGVISYGFLAKQSKNNFKLNKWEKIITAASLLIIMMSSYYYLFFLEKKEWGSTDQLYQYSKIYDLQKLVGKIGIVNYYLEDMISFMLQNNSLTPKDLQFVNQWLADRPKATPTKNNYGLAQGRNVIFIQVESLESAVMDKKINGQEITPYLNKLAQQGLYFTNYYSQLGPGNTADAEFVILNSLYPLENGVAFIEYANNKYDALPEFLKEDGYHTFVFHGDVPSFWNRANIYTNLGYDQWFSKNDFTVTRKVGFDDLGDESFLDQSLDKLKSLPQPFFSLLMTLTSHTPFDLPADLSTLSFEQNTNLNQNQKQYLQTIHYTDKAIGEFIENLKNTKLYNNSIIFIYGDHGSFTGISEALNKDNDTLPSLVGQKIPLIVLAPNLKLAEQIKVPASHLDLYPTLTNLLGYTAPNSVLGQDIFNAKNPVVTQRNLVSGTVRTILTSKLAYQAPADGDYKNGTCLKMPDQNQLPFENCSNLFVQQDNNIKISDLVIKGNAIDLLAKAIKPVISSLPFSLLK